MVSFWGFIFLITTYLSLIFSPKFESLNSSNLIFLTGKPFRRYSSFTEPQNMEQDIKFLLGEVPQPSSDGSAIEYYNSRMPKDLD